MELTRDNTAAFRVCAILLFAAGLGGLVLGFSWYPAPDVPVPAALFFLAFGVFTIIFGFPHRYYGHVSFDRVAQFSSLLVFGPVVAAAISGACYLIQPWRHLREGESLVGILIASMANAGMMTLVVLGSGSVYVLLGGKIPLDGLTPFDFIPLLVMALTANLINQGAIAWLVWVKGGNMRQLVSRFELLVDLCSFMLAVVFAVVYNALDVYSFALLVCITGIGMIVLQHFAMLRTSLDVAVEERTVELQAKTNELEIEANRDPLTGLFNRRFIDRRLADEAVWAEGYGRPLTLALADLDHFKSVNDHFSHATGDAVLQAAGAIFRDSLRETDLSARYGGEEFVLCLTDTPLEGGIIICDRLRSKVASVDWGAIAPGLSITVSFGLATLGKGEDVRSALARADENLYKAKASGRNCVIPSPSPMDPADPEAQQAAQ